MQKAFVIGGYNPNGGTYMAYHLGHILAEEFGISVSMVKVKGSRQNNDVFSYPVRYPQISMDEMEKTIAEDDILIANPSFSSLQMGARIKAQKIMYVQGVNTYSIIDGFFDYYISVSDFVRNFLVSTYNLVTPVIPPFIVDIDPPLIPWEKRDPHKVLVNVKFALSKTALNFFKSGLSWIDHHQDSISKLQFDVIDFQISHKDLLQKMSGYRYFLTLSPVEGFGLMPLEAMASGCLVVGFHAGGGGVYMRNGVNSIVCDYPDVDYLLPWFVEVLENPAKGKSMVEAALLEANKYRYHQFRKNWKAFFFTRLSGMPVSSY